MQEIDLRIEAGSGARGLHLTLIDEASGLLVANFVLSHEQLGRMVAATTLGTVKADVVDSRYINNLGKKRHTWRRMFRIQNPQFSEVLRRGETPDALTAWTDAVKVRCWAQTGSWSLRRGGLVAFTLERYCNELTPEQYEQGHECLNRREPPEGLTAE